MVFLSGKDDSQKNVSGWSLPYQFFQETFPGSYFQGKKPSGKVTIREMTAYIPDQIA